MQPLRIRLTNRAKWNRVSVTGVDISPNLVLRPQARANAEDLDAHFREGDAIIRQS